MPNDSFKLDKAVDQSKKASILLLALGGTLSSSFMNGFDKSEIKQFADIATALKDVDSDFLVTLVDELSEEVKKVQPLTGGEAQTRSFLEQALPEEKVLELYGNTENPVLDIWKRFTIDNEKILTPYLLDEHPQTISFIVSKLDPDLSPRVISSLPRDIRTSVIVRLMKMRPVNLIFDQIVQKNLQTNLLTKSDDHSKVEGRARIAKLLNKMDKENMEDILDALKIDSPLEAAAIKKLLFSFEDIVTLSQKDRLFLFDKIQTEKVMLALRGAPAELKEAVLSALGARARRMIESELVDASSEVTKDVTSARQFISETALRLGAEGLINLSEPETIIDIDPALQKEGVA